MALNGRVGHACSQAPHPIQISGLISGIVSSPIYGIICTAWVGQCSEQEPQAVLSVLTTQLSRIRLTFPICTVFFASIVSERIAPVGHTSLHITHSTLQYFVT